MNEDRFTSQNAWYHFVLGDIIEAIKLYGIDVVMTDIYDYLEVSKKESLEEARKGYLNPDLNTYDGMR
jgi:uncharacterized UPF0146 family protein